ncbi:MAG: AAA family ATPase [Burkholderiales bacterium]|nr:AAA family ATPase [Burkholderiales bacterium]
MTTGVLWTLQFFLSEIDLHTTRNLVSENRTGSARLDKLIAALRDPETYRHAGHAVGRVELLQTHISCVLLAGDYAYKIKKPVNLGFLDFSALDARRRYCDEELRLNRRTAPGLYLGVVAIGGSESAPLIGGGGPAIEYALRMRRFEQDDLLDRMAHRGALTPAHIDALARSLAAFHAGIDRAGSGDAFGDPAQILIPVLQNFEQLLPLLSAKADIALLARLRDWSAREHAALAPIFRTRKRDGRVRECHGDLHLGNIALLDAVPTPFDCIEFNAEFRWTDVMNEIAFLVMDLLDHRLPRLAFRFLNAYLEQTGDYAGLRVLRFYLVYRALVRAKVSCLRAHQPGIAAREKSEVEHEYRRHLHLAEHLAAAAEPAIVIMHGLSGSGKTTISQGLLETLGAVRLRSDVERKRLHGLSAQARSGAALNTGLYAPESSERTYAHLAELARAVLDARYPLIVDAAFLKREQRALFAGLAREARAGFLIATCTATAHTLRARVLAREREARDASEAGLAVLEYQLDNAQPLAPDELAHAMQFDAARESVAPEAAALARRLGLEPA